MSDYARQQDFSAKDVLATGNPAKVIKGSEVDAEFDAALTAINSKVDEPSSPTQDDVLQWDGSVVEWASRGIVQKLGGVVPASNLKVIIGAIPTQTVQITADELTMFRPATGGWSVLPAVDVSPNMAVSGIDGLDTGSETSDTWYHCYVVWDGIFPATSSNVKGLFSLSPSAPTLGTYTHQAYCGAVYNDDTSNFDLFGQSGELALTNRQTILTDGAATTWTSVDLSGFCPTTAKSVILQLAVSNTTPANAASCTISSTTGGGIESQIRTPGGAGSMIASVEVPLLTAQTVWYQVGDAADRATIALTGWRF